MRFISGFGYTLALFALSMASFAAVKAPFQVEAPKQTDQAGSSQTSGEEVFKAHCSRCHMPPMILAPRITGTVVMHMRTRARLSRNDEQELLRFLAP